MEESCAVVVLDTGAGVWCTTTSSASSSEDWTRRSVSICDSMQKGQSTTRRECVQPINKQAKSAMMSSHALIVCRSHYRDYWGTLAGFSDARPLGI